MASYIPPLDDIAFLLSEVLDFDRQISTLPGFEDVNAELAISILDEAGKFCVGVLEPLNRTADEEGCTLEGGLVSTPDGIAAAYRAFAQAGWTSLSGSPPYGGQGLPRSMQLLLDEMIASVNLSFGLFPGLTRGAVEAIENHASDGLKQTYLPKMISGEWTGAMALTEASAGSDLGLLSTRAEPNGDGSYAIKGTKIFISSGDHDFGGNIVHLVLARMLGAEKGVKGISLFLVPKFLVVGDGELGERNRMSVGSIEHKMGIHGQPTCLMNYDGATGWLIGEAGRGLNAMFTMMNAERLFVGIQGLGIAEAANQKAVDYARQRMQGRAPDASGRQVAIIEHPDIRRMLLIGRSFVDAARALAIWVAIQMEVGDRHSDQRTRETARNLVALLTPIVKSAFTDFGFETAVLSQQVFGGHGYIREWGMEQFVRDARITQIYEGTNGIQALDLVGRKLTMDGGATAKALFRLMESELQSASVVPGARKVAIATLDALARLERATSVLLEDQSDQFMANAGASDYLRLFAITTFGWMLAKMSAKVKDTASHLLQRKLAAGDFFADRILPQAAGHEACIVSGSTSMMALDKEAF